MTKKRSTYSEMRVAIVGTCQVAGMRVALQAHLPGALVEAYHVGVHPLMSDTEIAARIDGYDYVITQMLDVHGHPELELGPLGEKAAAASLVPPLVFTGFHPDSVYIFNQNQPVPSEIGYYHSAIAASSFLLGLPATRALRLYNSYVYGELGYFVEYDQSREMLVESFKPYGFDLGPYVDVWQREGYFMHTINHPKVNVLATLATLAARDAGVIDRAAQTPVGLPDGLEQSVAWAVYPEISRRLGMPEGAGFLRAAGTNGAARGVELEELIRASYEQYRSLPAESIYGGNVARVHDTLKTLL